MEVGSPDAVLQRSAGLHSSKKSLFGFTCNAVEIRPIASKDMFRLALSSWDRVAWGISAASANFSCVIFLRPRSARIFAARIFRMGWGLMTRFIPQG